MTISSSMSSTPAPVFADASTVWVVSRPMMVSICSLMGRSNRPLKKTAWSWQPAHHFEGRVPTTSCMYSMDFRYHWLLKEEKWWAEELHCA